MIFEHFALNVADAHSVSLWYQKYLGLKVARERLEPYAGFLADESGRVVVELYTHPDAPVPDYRAVHSRAFHVAFLAPEPAKIRDRLIAGGATLESEEESPDGSYFIMMRDPWGIPLQLVKRAQALSQS